MPAPPASLRTLESQSFEKSETSEKRNNFENSKLGTQDQDLAQSRQAAEVADLMDQAEKSPEEKPEQPRTLDADSTFEKIEMIKPLPRRDADPYLPGSDYY